MQTATVPRPGSVHCRAALALAAATLAAHAHAGPDLVISDITTAAHWTGLGPLEGYRAYTFGAQYCNIGDAPAAWNPATADHPALAHGVFRLQNGRLEQIGLSWMAHEATMTPSPGCGTCLPAPGALGPGCSTSTYATQTVLWENLGPRSQVDPAAGAFVFPLATGPQQPWIHRRVRLIDTDIRRPGALFFVEALVVHPGDAQAGASANNASYRRIDFIDPDLHVLFRGATQAERPVIYAWRDHGLGINVPDPAVRVSEVDVPGDGRVLVASKATALTGGRWRYEYAVQNVSSARSVAAFLVPLGAGSSAFGGGFRDVNYHSGEPFAGDDWPLAPVPGGVEWRVPFAPTPTANAIRFGCLYNFWFESNRPPRTAAATLSLLIPGSPSTVEALVTAPDAVPCPGDANGDNRVDFIDLGIVLSNYGTAGPGGDLNGDGIVDMQDLNLVLGAFGVNC